MSLRIGPSAVEVMAYYNRYEKYAVWCQLALSLGLMFFIAALIAVGHGWYDVTNKSYVWLTPGHQFLISAACVIAGIIAGRLYLYWVPKRQDALRKYQQVTSLDVW